jgi:hypothetical protein
MISLRRNIAVLLAIFAAASLATIVLFERLYVPQGQQQTVQHGATVTALLKPALLSRMPLPHHTNSVTTKAVSQISVPTIATPDLVVAQMSPQAKQGSAESMRYLGEALRRCAMADMSDDRTLQNRQIDEQLQLEEALKGSGSGIDSAQQAKNVATNIAEKAELREACAKLDPGQIKGWLEWLERSALAGDIDAKRDYANSALTDYQAGVAVSDLDEAVRRRDLARQFSEDLLASGDCSVLNNLHTTAVDLASAYAYELAYVENTKAAMIRAGSDPNTFGALDNYMAGQAARVPPEQLDAARSASDYVLQTYCGR